MSRTFCYHCASKLEQKDERSWYCKTCQQTYFENAAAGTEAIITNDKGEVLVITRAREPYKGELDFPGGFVDFDETIEEALYREIHEEVGLQKTDLTDPVYITSYFMPYPWGKDTIHVAVSVYAMKLRGKVKLEALDDVSDVQFIKFDAEAFKGLLEYRGTGNITEKVAQALS